MSLLRHLARRPLSSRPFHLDARPFQLKAGSVRVHVSAPKPEPPRPRRPVRHNIFWGSLTAMALESDHRPSVMARRQFHSTSRREAIPFLGLAGLLKVCYFYFGISVAQSAMLPLEYTREAVRRRG